MGLIREPKDVDFSMKSEPWTEEELIEFRKIMAKINARDARRKEKSLQKKSKKKVIV